MKHLLTPLLLAAATSLPVYPGAAHVTDESNPACGVKVTRSIYLISNAGWETVETWYRSRLSGAIVYVPGPNKGVELFTPDGRDTGAAGEHDAKAFLSLNFFDPPLPSDRIADLRAASRGDAAAKARLKKACPVES